MKIVKNVPIVITDKFAEVREFYLTHFAFSVIFEHDTYLGLKSADGTVELSFMKPCDHAPVFDGKGVTFCFEVEDVDAQYDHLKNAGLEIDNPPCNNPWGDRSFKVVDPVGIALYIYKMIPPSKEFESCFKE